MDIAVKHNGAKQRVHSRSVFAEWKPLIWYTKGQKPNILDTMFDHIESSPPDKRLHELAQSKEEVEHIIRYLTVENQTILDPMFGSGTTGIAALKLNRKFIGTDVNKRTETIENYEKENGYTLKNIDKNLKSLQSFWNENQRQDSEVKMMLNQIIQKIGGTGIGNVGEIMVIHDLKQVSPMDYFDDTRAAKHGSDIVAKVNENGIICGSITISVKCTLTWSNEFMSQITRDMKVDGSRCGILVTRAFPKEALSDKACIRKTDEGNSVILVKPEYASLAYFGLRQATLNL